MIIIAFFVLYMGLALLLAVKVFRLLKQRGWMVALLVSLLSLSALALFLTIPIHGGFTFPLEIAWHELKREKWQKDETRSDEKRFAFKNNMKRRFAGPINLEATKRVANGWSSTQIAEGKDVWLDEESGLLWLAPQSVVSGENMLALAEAKEFCRKQPRQGYWSLPSEAELALFWQHGGQRWMPGTGQSSTAVLLDSDLRLEMATHYRGRVTGHALRCVAITDLAPRSGYHSGDIPLALWNDYQMSKVEIYSSTTKQTFTVPNQEIK